MSFSNILVVESNKKTKNHLDSAENLRNILKKTDLDFEWVSVSELSGRLFRDIDLVMTLGGDGVFIEASHFIRDTLLLGLNSDSDTSEGALKEISAMDTECIVSILNGEYKINQKTRARVTKNGGLVKELALNEVYAGAENQFHTSRYIIDFNGKKEEQRSSGVLITTGTGSNAWYNSAGGEPFAVDSGELKFLVREPYSGKLFTPQILGGIIENGKSIKISSTRLSGGVIAIDGEITYPFNIGDIIEVKVSNQKLNVITRK